MKRNFLRGSGYVVLIALVLLFGYSKSFGQPAKCNNKKADKLLQDGAAEFDKKNYQQAVSFFDQAAKAAPKCPIPYFKKGDALFYLEQYDEAVVALQESIKRNYAEPWRPHALICTNYFNLQKYQESISSCRETARLNPKYGFAFLLMAKAHFVLKDYEASLATVKTAVELIPDESEARMLRGLNLINLKRRDEATADLAEATRLKPNEALYFALLGENYYNLKEYAKSIPPLVQALKLNREDGHSWRLLTVAYSTQGNWAKVEEAARESVRLDPAGGNGYFLLGSALLMNGKLDEATKTLDASIKNKTLLQVSAAVYKGVAYIGLKKPAQAGAAFDEALTLVPADGIDHLNLSQIFFYRWELDKAREQLKKAAEVPSNDSNTPILAYALLSWSYSLANDPQSAVIAANAAIEQNPKKSSGYSYRCRAYNDLNLPDIAIKDCQKSLEIEPDEGETLYYLSRAYGLKKNKVEEKNYNLKAIKSLERSLGISFAQPVNIFVAAQAQPGNKQSVNISSPVVDVYLYLLGNAYVNEKNFPAAINAYENLVELRPKFPQLRFNLGVCYLNLPKPNLKNAEIQYKALLELDKKRAADLRKHINDARNRR
jgi:tetratricopeptide (TPR) repeat protein